MGINREQAGKLIAKRDGLIAGLNQFAENIKAKPPKSNSVDWLAAQTYLIGMKMKAICIKAEMKKAKLA